MRHFLDGEEAPQDFDVHVWEAAVAAPQQTVLRRTCQPTVTRSGLTLNLCTPKLGLGDGSMMTVLNTVASSPAQWALQMVRVGQHKPCEHHSDPRTPYCWQASRNSCAGCASGQPAGGAVHCAVGYAARLRRRPQQLHTAHQRPRHLQVGDSRLNHLAAAHSNSPAGGHRIYLTA